jgi:hypothetical protein
MIMRSIGGLLMLFGIGSFILKTMDREFRLLQWIDNWGESTGNIIRVALAVVGLVLVVLSFKKKPAAGANDDTATT